MTLKNVVLPAPFGPMRLTIEPSGMTKSMFETATSPPNCFVTARASRTFCIPVIARRPPGWRAPARARPRPPPRRAARHGASRSGRGLRSQQHHRHQRDAEDELARAAHVHDRQVLIADRGTDAVNQTVDPVEQDAVDEAEQEPAGDDPADVAETAQDDHAEDEDR